MELGLEICGFILLFLVCITASAGGAGGGGVFVPILLLFFQKDFAAASTLSQIIVLGNSFSQTFLNIGKVHPVFSKCPLIFWELVIVLQPAMLGGSNIGSILSKVLPPSVLYLIALIVLSYAIYMSFRKAVHRYHDELESEKLSLQVDDSSSQPTRLSISPIDEVLDVSETIMSEVRSSSVAIEEIFRDTFTRKNQPEKSSVLPQVKFPIHVLQVIILMWTAYTCLLVGVAISSACSTNYIVLLIVLYVPLACGSYWGVRNAQNLGDMFQPAKNEVSIDAIELNERKSNPLPNSTSPNGGTTLAQENQGNILRENALVLTVCTFCIGIICSLLGIGGGELLSPMMLSFHIIPQVVSATSGTLSFWNSLALVIRACVLGKVKGSEGVLAIIIGLFGGFIGRKIGLRVSSTYNRSSFIIFSLVLILILSAIYYVVELSIGSFESSLDSLC